MKKVFDFGKIPYTNSKRKANRVTISVELRKKGGKDVTTDHKTGEEVITGKSPEYMELTITGEIWNSKDTDTVCGGQCLDEIMGYLHNLNDQKLFLKIYDLWKNYHLNGMHAGTPEQEQAIAEWIGEGNEYDFPTVCKILKERGLYEVNYSGLSYERRYENEPYRYGSSWLVQELPDDVLTEVKQMLSA